MRLQKTELQQIEDAYEQVLKRDTAEPNKETNSKQEEKPKTEKSL
jgi:hypothetical protein